VEVANRTMINAYLAGIPGNGKPFPDGSKIAKIECKPKKMVESPFAVNVPDTKGWGYAVTISLRPRRSRRTRLAQSIAVSRAIRK
jgi:hypothetical protein